MGSRFLVKHAASIFGTESVRSGRTCYGKKVIALFREIFSEWRGSFTPNRRQMVAFLFFCILIRCFYLGHTKYSLCDY